MSRPALPDMVAALAAMPTPELRALARAIAAEIERRQKPRKLL